jgi:kynurenine formamidase
MGRIVDLSHVIDHGMVTYPGLPGPEISDHLTREASRAHYAPGTEFHIGRITMVANTGTYLDTPAHRYPNGTDLVRTPLERMVELDAVVIDVVGRLSVEPDVLQGHRIGGRAVLIHTGWSRHWGTEAYFTGHPYLSGEGGAWLADRGAALVGIDSLNIDGTATGERPAHSSLLAAGIPIVEHLCQLDQLPSEGFRFSAAPAAVVGLGSFPVRAYAVIDESPAGDLNSGSWDPADRASTIRSNLG